ncbi:MAG: efflux RND transporter periplasmic adaptor subunit [Phycisphaerales bacterium]
MRPVMRMNAWVLVASVCAASSAQPVAMVRVDGARLESVEQMRRVTGELRALRRSELATQEEGLVLELLVRAGDPVEAGEVIARLDDERARLDLDRLEAELESLRATEAVAQAEVDRSATELERVRLLREQASASAQELEDAQFDAAADEARLLEAQADVRAAERRIELARTRLDDLSVRAPFDGRVIRTLTEAGQWLQRGDSVVELYATDDIEAWIDVPERYYARIAESDQPVSVEIAALSSSFEATITRIVPAADPLSRLFPVRMRVAGAGDRLRPGMSVVAEVPTGSTGETLTIHKDAILRNEAGEFVYQVVPNPFGEGQVASPTQVSRLFAVGNRVAIRAGGVGEGSVLIVEGNERLYPMAAVMVQREGAPVAGGGPSGSQEG